MHNYGYGHHPYVGAAPFETDVVAALSRRFLEIRNAQERSGQLIAPRLPGPPSNWELADLALQMAIELYGAARLSGPQIVERVQQTLATIRR